MTDPIRQALELLISDIECLANNSGGVHGLHKNGDLAPWPELMEGGDFSSWLGDAMATGRAALAPHLDGTPQVSIGPAVDITTVGELAALKAELMEDGYDREGEIAALILDHSYVDPERNLGRVLRECDFGATARAILARCSQPPAAAPAASDGEREELARELEKQADDYDDLYPPAESLKLYRAAELLRAPAPVAVPVAVSEPPAPMEWPELPEEPRLVVKYPDETEDFIAGWENGWAAARESLAAMNPNRQEGVSRG